MATRLIKAATSSTICIGSLYWRTNLLQPDSFLASANLFGPYCARRFSTSAALRPTLRIDALRLQRVLDG